MTLAEGQESEEEEEEEDARHTHVNDRRLKKIHRRGFVRDDFRALHRGEGCLGSLSLSSERASEDLTGTGFAITRRFFSRLASAASAAAAKKRESVQYIYVS